MPFDERRLLLNGLQPSRPARSDPLRPTKRRKTDGLNDRFDRMVQTVNVMHGSSSMLQRRARGRITSTSSVTGREAPQTPVVAYSDLDGGRSSRNPPVLKMRRSQPSVGHSDMFEPEAFCERDFSTATVPPWLMGTLSSLDSKHPLRLLVPAPPGGSSPSALEPSSDSVITSGLDESPFAFTPSLHIWPKESEVGVPLHADGHDVPGDKASLEPSFADPAVFRRMSTRLSVDPALRFPTHVVEDDPMRPFSTPGPSSTLGATSPVRSRRPLWLVGATAQDRATFVHTEARRVESPSLAFVPFSTPGPLCSPAHLDHDVVSDTGHHLEEPAIVSSPLSPHLHIQASRPLGYAKSPEFATRGDILARPASFSASSPGGLLSSAPDFVPFTAPGPTTGFRDPVALSPYMRSDISRPHSPGLMLALHHDIDFRWRRFDRNRIAEGTSSPIGFSVENSEETFWSQPAPKTPYMKEHLECDLPTDSMRDLHSLPNPSTPPRPCSSQSRRLTDDAIPKPDIPPDTSSQLTQTGGDNTREDNENPFVWIVPPRDIPPSTPPRKVVQNSADDTGRATPPVQEAPVSVKCIPQHNDAVVSESVDINAPERRRRPPFAPAPGIYVSPLRGRDTSPRMAMEASTSSADERYHEGNGHLAERQASDHRELQSTEDAIEEADSQPSEKVALSQADDMQDDIEDVDELEGCSQDSRDTIESWTQ